MAEQPAPEDPAEEDPAGKERQESLWASFNRADKKLFLVTFAGTLAANVMTVMVVAVAIIFARYSTRNSPPFPLVVFSSLIMVVFGIAALGVGLTDLIRRRTPTRKALVVTMVGGLATLESLLILLGLAIGVK